MKRHAAFSAMTGAGEDFDFVDEHEIFRDYLIRNPGMQEEFPSLGFMASY
jgi:hypothetical protein